MNDFSIKREAWHKLCDKCPSVMRSHAFFDLVLTPKGNYIEARMGDYISFDEHIDDFPSDVLIARLWLIAK